MNLEDINVKRDSEMKQPLTSAAAPQKRSTVQLITIALVAALAFIAFVLGCYATNKVNSLDGKVNASPASTASVLLVTSPMEAKSKGLTTIGNLYRGSGYWAANPTSMAHARSDHGAISYQGNIYLFGGQALLNITEGAQVISNFTRYNMYLGTVDEMPGMPEPRYRFGYALVADQLYIFGGLTALEENGGALATSTLVFSFSSLQWLPLGNNYLPLLFPRPDLWGGSVNGKIYAVGGYNSSSAEYNPVNNVEMLDVANGAKKWVSVAGTNIPRGDLRVIASNGILYALGGITLLGNGNCPDWFSCHPWTASVEAYDMVSNSWKNKTSMNWARGDFATVTLSNGHILAMGGENNYMTKDISQTAFHLVAQPWVEEYNPLLDIWVPKAAMFEPRFRFDAATDDGNFVYAFGGAPTCDDNTPGRSCYKTTLSSIIGFFDNLYPDLWAAKV